MFLFFSDCETSQASIASVASADDATTSVANDAPEAHSTCAGDRTLKPGRAHSPLILRPSRFHSLARAPCLPPVPFESAAVQRRG